MVLTILSDEELIRYARDSPDPLVRELAARLALLLDEAVQLNEDLYGYQPD